MIYRLVKRLTILFPVIFFSCLTEHGKNSGEILARVHNDYLYLSELQDVVPTGTAVKDSIVLVKNFANNWVLQRLLVYKAEKNLTDENKDFKKQLEEYRNSLIIYQYESKLVRQNLDTIVSDKEISDFYEQHIAKFELKNNIVRVNYILIDTRLQQADRIRGFFFSDEPDDRDSLVVYCMHHAETCFLDDEAWILFDNLKDIIPLQVENEESYLRNNLEIEVKDDPYLYLVKFLEYRIKNGGSSPLGFEKENIKQIIFNQRKLNLINKMHDEVFQNALDNNDFEIYLNW